MGERKKEKKSAVSERKKKAKDQEEECRNVLPPYMLYQKLHNPNSRFLPLSPSAQHCLVHSLSWGWRQLYTDRMFAARARWKSESQCPTLPVMSTSEIGILYVCALFCQEAGLKVWNQVKRTCSKAGKCRTPACGFSKIFRKKNHNQQTFRTLQRGKTKISLVFICFKICYGTIKHCRTYTWHPMIS